MSGNAAGRYAVIGLGLIFFFIALILILVRVMPGPLKPVDYMVIGSIATFLCLLAALAVFLITNEAARATFFGKPRTPRDP